MMLIDRIIRVGNTNKLSLILEVIAIYRIKTRMFTLTGMHTSLIYEYYDEKGVWLGELNTIQKLQHGIYLGNLNDSNVSNLVKYLNKPDVLDLDKKLYSENNIEVLNTYCYSELRANVVIIYMQFMINMKPFENET